MTIQFETERYALSQDRFGHFRLTRKADNASAYFQGDDAALWDSNMEMLETLEESQGWRAGNSLVKSFDFLCSGYDEVLQVES